MEYENDDIFLCKGQSLDNTDPALIGKALANCSFGGRVGISTDGGNFSKSLAYSLTGSLTANSSQVWSFGDSFLSQLRFFVDFCSLPCGIFISQNSSNAKIRVLGRYGLPLCAGEQKELEEALVKKNFKNTDIYSCSEVTDMTGVNMMYRRELIRQSDTELSELSCNVKCENKKISMLMEDCFYRLGCKDGDDYTFKINNDGTSVSVFSRDCGWIANDRILAVITNYETQNGRDICVLPDAPLILDKIAGANGRRVVRFHGSDSGDAVLLNSDAFMRDALFASVRLLKIIDDTGKSLLRLNRELPQFYISKKRISVDLNSDGGLLKIKKSPNAELTRDGAVLSFPHGKVRLSSVKNGRELSIIAEAVNYEISKDLCKRAEEFCKKEFETKPEKAP